MSNQLATIERNGNGHGAIALARPTGTRMLSVHAPGGVIEAAPAPDAIATISAGAKRAGNNGDVPYASKDGAIHLHDSVGNAPGLRAAIEAGGGKRLTVAMPFNDRDLFIHQHFALWTASALKAHGDERSITEIVGTERRQHAAGTKEYENLRRQSKNNVSVYFYLATWGDDGKTPRIVLPDGLGLYRLRFTSTNSLRSLISTLVLLERATKGPIAGVPLDLFLDYRDTVGSDGKKRRICVWQFRMKPPATISFDSFNLRDLMKRSLEQGEAMAMLPAPAPETIETALAEEPLPDLDDTVVDHLKNGGLCDARHWERTWFATVKDTQFASDAARAAFIASFTKGFPKPTVSLSEYLAGATEEEASDLITAVKMDLAEPAATEGVIEDSPAPASDLIHLDPDAKRAAATEADLAAYELMRKELLDLGEKAPGYLSPGSPYWKYRNRMDLATELLTAARRKQEAQQVDTDPFADDPKPDAEPPDDVSEGELANDVAEALAEDAAADERGQVTEPGTPIDGTPTPIDETRATTEEGQGSPLTECPECGAKTAILNGKTNDPSGERHACHYPPHVVPIWTAIHEAELKPLLAPVNRLRRMKAVNQWLHEWYKKGPVERFEQLDAETADLVTVGIKTGSLTW